MIRMAIPCDASQRVSRAIALILHSTARFSGVVSPINKSLVPATDSNS